MATRDNRMAENLKDAFNVLDPNHSVTPEQVETFFVERPHSDVDAIHMRLKLCDQPTNLLFVGHRGAGKSSEMAYLASLLAEGDFVCVPVPIYQIFQSPSVSHGEVVLAMSLRLIKIAADENIVGEGWVQRASDTVEPVYNFLKQLLFGTTPVGQETLKGELKTEINLLAAKIESKIGTEARTRDEVREALSKRINEMIEQINQIVLTIRTTLDKRVVFIVEDLDKFNRKDTSELFLQHAKTLTSTSAHAIFSFPVSMRYTDDFPEIKNAFSDAFHLHNIAVKHRDGSPDAEGCKVMREIAARRVEPKLFEKGVVDRAVEYSGGHVKTFIQLLQSAVLNAILKKKGRVDAAHLDAAVRRLRDDFVTMLNRNQLELLRKFRDDPKKDLTDVHNDKQSLLYNGSLYEYDNTYGPWGDVNPIVLDLLNRHE